jgi:DNA polymerase alpha-associated DNA helicase A
MGYRMNQTMGRLLKMKSDEYSSFVRVLFGLTSPSPEDQSLVGEVEWVDDSLNESQKEAIKFALASREMALIHGPPGVSICCFLCIHKLLMIHVDWENSYID